MYDALIVGSEPARLSAALWLGRCQRQMLVRNTGKPRDAATRAVHRALLQEDLATVRAQFSHGVLYT